MATIQDKLADSLQELQRHQQGNSHTIIRSSDLSRIHIVRLVDSGFLQEVMKGWYISTHALIAHREIAQVGIPLFGNLLLNIPKQGLMMTGA